MVLIYEATLFFLKMACGFNPALKGYPRMSRLENAWIDIMTSKNLKRYLTPNSSPKVSKYKGLTPNYQAGMIEKAGRLGDRRWQIAA